MSSSEPPDALDRDYGFDPPDRITAPRPVARRRRSARRLASAGCLVGALLALTLGVLALSGSATAQAPSGPDVTAGASLYRTSCITCHGRALEGIRGQGPSLIGVGGAAVYFQVSTGRMPLDRQGAYAEPHPAKYTERETRQLSAYVQSAGGGPDIPSGRLQASSDLIGKGGEIFRLSCSQCHGATGHGAPLSAGQMAPSLYGATDTQVWTAMLSGPENMPVFGDNTITPEQKREIVAYVRYLERTKDPGGNGIGRIGPVSEAIVIWVAGVGLLMLSILWIGSKTK